MAYSSGTFTGPGQLVDAIVTFATANGWTNHDNVIASNDVVLKSAGTSGKTPMYMRLTINTSIDNPYKNPAFPSKVLPEVMVRGYHYWNNSTHVGTNEYGIMGPILTLFAHGGTYNGQIFHLKIDSTTGATVYNNDVTYQAAQYATNTTTTLYRQWSDYAGNRFHISTAPGSASPGVVDLVTGDTFVGSNTLNGLNVATSKGCFAYDATTDKWFAYYLPANANIQADSHMRYDFEADTWTRMASVPWTVNQNGSSWMLWDGGDFIYIIVGSSSTSFYRYSISGNSYTVRAVTPVAFGNTTSFDGAILVPSTVTGFTSDVIYVMGVNAGTTLHSYNITSNAWNDTGNGTGNLTIPSALDASCGIMWDSVKYAYFYKRNALTLLYRMDLTNTAGGWATSGNSFNAQTNTVCTGTVMNTPVCQLRCTAASVCNYWIQGNADSITVVTKLPISSGRYYWGNFGKIQTRRRSNIATSTASASAGTNVSIAVDASTGYVAGDYIFIVDPTNGTQEAAIVYAIPDGTHIQFTIVNSYTSGSFIGADPFQTIITGDTGFACAPIDPKGYKKDFEAAYYLLRPSFDTLTFNTTAMDGMGYIEPTEPNLVQFNQSSTVTSYRYGILGSPLNIFFQPQSSYPGPQAEDTLTVNSQQYIYFPQQTIQRFANIKYGIVIPTF